MTKHPCETDPDELFLAAPCSPESSNPETGRVWSNDPDMDRCEDCGRGSTRYVRFDRCWKTRPGEPGSPEAVAARQQHVASCCAEQYGAASAHDTATRALKAVEEAIELAHAAGITASQLRRLIDRDYAKAPGDLTTELGQLRANTLLVAATLDLDADALERDTAAELASRSVAECQAKAAEKERYGTETPDTPVAPSDTPDTGDAL